MLINKTNNMPIEKVVSIKNVSKNYGDIQAVKDVTFSVEKSQTLGLLGSNGAGKTTIIMMLLGILKSSSGQINILNKDIYKYRNLISKEINFASPFVELPHKLTVLQNLTVFGHIYGVKNLSMKIEKLSKDSPKNCGEKTAIKPEINNISNPILLCGPIEIECAYNKN